jgi:hypothetical protein
VSLNFFYRFWQHHKRFVTLAQTNLVVSMLNGLMKEKDEESYEITVIIAGTNSKSP